MKNKIEYYYRIENINLHEQNNIYKLIYLILSTGYGRLAQLVRAPALQAGGHRFESYIAHHNAEIAQLVEQLICNQQVTGSSPVFGTIFFGEVAKWLNATDCKSVPSGSMVRIHLSPPLIASQPSGKASDFDSDMRQFESSRGSHLYFMIRQLSWQSI